MKVWSAPPPTLATPPVWDVQRGALGQLPSAQDGRWYLPQLRTAAARVLVAAKGADLVFVGRSPEPLYYYLRGLLDGGGATFTVGICNVSLGSYSVGVPRPEALHALLSGAGLHPCELVRQDRQAALVNVVASGDTFKLLARELQHWAEAEGTGKCSVHRRVRFVGLTHRYSGPWAAGWRFETASVRLSDPLWNYLGNSPEKIAPYHPSGRWGQARAYMPERTPQRLQALADARMLLTTGLTISERRLFARELSQWGAQEYSHLRTLGLRLVGKARQS